MAAPLVIMNAKTARARTELLLKRKLFNKYLPPRRKEERDPRAIQ
jgi:hypothetical protein